MKTTRRFVGIGGACVTLAALSGQPIVAGDSPLYLKFDAGVTMLQDTEVDTIEGLGDLPATFTSDGTDDILGIDLPGGTYKLDKPEFKFDAGFRFDLTAGYKVSETVAVELETGFLYNSFDKVKASGTFNGTPWSGEAELDAELWQVPLLLNGVYTFKLDSKFKPFVGVGLGGILAMVSADDTDESSFTFAYQAKAGVDYMLNDSISLELAYKFLGTLGHDFDGVETAETFSHSILAGLTYKF